MNNELQPIDATSEIVLYQPDENIKLDVRISNDTVWLTRNQMATLFGRDVKTIGKHINNALREELAVSVVAKNAITDPITTTLSKNATLRTENPVVAKFATTASDGKVHQTEHYSLDMILSVGYRVHSPQGIAFRAWANQVLKQYLLRGYAINHQLVALQERVDERFTAIEQRIDRHEEQIAFFIRTNQPPIEGIFYKGQVLDARDFAENLIKTAQREVLLIDNYIDARTFQILEVRNPGVTAAIYVERIGNGLRTLQQTSHTQTTRTIDLRTTSQRMHDRFLIIDDTVYHLGASLNELGKRLFAFSKMSISKTMLV